MEQYSETNIVEFSFTLKSHKASKGDIVCTQKIPSDIDENKIIEVTGVKITSIDSFNQFFPREAAQELYTKISTLQILFYQPQGRVNL